MLYALLTLPHDDVNGGVSFGTLLPFAFSSSASISAKPQVQFLQAFFFGPHPSGPSYYHCISIYVYTCVECLDICFVTCYLSV